MNYFNISPDETLEMFIVMCIYLICFWILCFVVNKRYKRFLEKHTPHTENNDNEKLK